MNNPTAGDFLADLIVVLFSAAIIAALAVYGLPALLISLEAI